MVYVEIWHFLEDFNFHQLAEYLITGTGYRWVQWVQWVQWVRGIRSR